jgi:hypothetical protein
MKHLDMKNKVLAMIEEVSPNNANLTDDPDIAAKYNEVTNQVLFELARMKKIPKYAEIEVSKGDILTFDTIGSEVNADVYQISLVGGVRNTPKADGTVYKVMEDGTAEVECYVYPKRITTDNEKTYEFDLTDDVLEIMPYGIAADLLKSDISTEYGSIYATRYESMLQRLDPRYNMPSIYIEGGVSI